MPTSQYMLSYPKRISSSFSKTHRLPGEDDIGGSLLDDEARVGADEEPSKIGRHFATNIIIPKSTRSRVSQHDAKVNAANPTHDAHR